LPLAVSSHATSKIADADDLFRVSSFGFRGEALASIAEVSRMSIRSRTHEADAGAQLDIVGGNREAIEPCASAPGTTIEVGNLFFNTPVRRKFLKTTQTEMGHAIEAFTRMALGTPGAHFTLRHNQRTVHDLPRVDDWKDRIAAIYGAELAADLIWVESNDDNTRVHGYAANPTHSRANNRMQYLFINGRFVRDRALQHALGEAYRGLLLTGRYPVAFLAIDLPAARVDVNVHPTKMEVRFEDSGKLYSQLLSTLRGKFLTTDLTAKADETAGADQAEDQDNANQHRQQFVQWAKGQLEPQRTSQSPLGAPPLETNHAPLELATLSRHGANAETVEYDETEPVGMDAALADFEQQTNDHIGTARPRAASALQIHNRYLVTENEEGVVVIDQHALHERILYEQIREKVLAGAIESQRLLVPESIDLTSEEAAAALEHREILAGLGVEIESFGGDTILISSFPAMLANFRPAEVLRELIDCLVTSGRQPDQRDLVDELLHTISCKAAIKAGDYLAPEEIETLLEQRDLAQDAHHCPHGRPTSLVFSRKELDRRFKRT
ncbi:MAG: DNA mismatch repair endonuclease MutL, partial [Pirellulales bacterium]|nr:DNA mismatch repair endonuclease MutL [Pirellulales bacterium]